MYAVELLEDLLQVLLLHTDARVAHGEVEVVVIVPSLQIDVDGLVGLTVFHRVVHQVEDHVLEVYLVDIDTRVYSFHVDIDLAAGVFHAQGKRVGDGLHHLIEVEMLLLKR